MEDVLPSYVSSSIIYDKKLRECLFLINDFQYLLRKEREREKLMGGSGSLCVFIVCK